MRRTLFPIALTLLASQLGCFGVGDIDRTNPNKVPKSLFIDENGQSEEWYFRQTVIDVPATSAVSFIGEQGTTERIIWDITEDYLFAYRAYPWLSGETADEYVRPGTGPFQGAPVAAYRIESHFDVQRQYNPSTGEQTNVIVENTSDRNWYDREFMRVSWEDNVIADFQFSASAVVQSAQANYTIPQDDSEAHTSKDQTVLTEDYIDTVQKVTTQPELNALLTDIYGFPIPECWLGSSITKDCLGGDVRIRSSFMKVKPSDYMPQSYDDQRFRKFGFFRTKRYTYDEQYGVTEPGVIRLSNRYNIWTDAESCYDPTASLPYASCDPSQLRTIVYYLNEDFPEEYKSYAVDNAEEWNRVFVEAVKASTGWTDADYPSDHRMFTLCTNNPVVEGDPEECGPVGTNPQIGDLRYSMYYYVANEQASSPLGYGPSAADPLTGEIIQGNAFYYGAAGKWIAARTRDSLKLDMGLLDDEQIAGGFPARQAIQNQRNLEESRRAMREIDIDHIKQSIERRDIAGKARRLKQMIDSGELFHDPKAARREAVARSGLDEYLVTEEMTAAFGVPQELTDGSFKPIGLTQAHQFLSPELFSYQRERLNRLLSPRAGGCILTAADVFDEGLVGTLQFVKNKFYDVTTDPPQLKPGVTEEDVYQFIVGRTMGDTQLHELGHTFGLRHNFSGSADALNFGPHYWELKGPGFLMGQDDDRPVPEWQATGFYRTGLDNAIANGLRDEQDSSVMDYASTYGTNTSLGMYDLAAIKYAYGDVVETFEGSDLNDERMELLRGQRTHYTFYPELISNGATYEDRVAAMYNRGNINYRMTDPSDELYDDSVFEVPYNFCSDEYREAQSACQIWDQGVTPYERTVKMIKDYRSYYIFDAFKRERLTFGADFFAINRYLRRIYDRRFYFLTNQYKQWVNDALIVRSGQPCITYENGQRVENGQYAFDEKCGLDGYIASLETINLFADVLETPDIGCYVRLKEGCYEIGANNTDGLQGDPVTLVDADPDFCDTYEPVQTDPQNRVIKLKIASTTAYKHVEDSTTCEGWQPIVDDAGETMSEAPIEVPLGVGRPSITTYDRDRYGYYFYSKPLVIGYWWDKWMAVRALGDSDTQFIGTDQSSDTRSYLISLTALFSEDINNVVGGLVNEEPSVYGPRVNAGRNGVEFLDLTSLNGSVDRSQSTQPFLDPDQQYTLKPWAMFNTDYNGYYTDDLEFGESLRVEPALSVTDILVDDEIRNDPTRFAMLRDPQTGYYWYAVRQDRQFFGSDQSIYSVGYEMIRKIKRENYVGGEDGPGLVLRSDKTAQDVAGDIRFMKIMSATAATFGYADVWSGDFFQVF